MALRAQARRPQAPLHERPFVWSYSKLKNYESCPKRHYEVDIAKNWTESTTNLDYGNAVHDALSKAIGDVNGRYPDGSDAKPLSDDYSELQPYVDSLRAARTPGVRVYTELRLAITKEFGLASDYFGPDVWFRANVDVAVVKPPVAIIKDWKTGKVLDDSPQLRLTAICTFARFPLVQRIKSTFEWLKHDDQSHELINREDIPRIWNELAPRVNELEAAYKNPDVVEAFPPNPGFLCRRHCPVKSCPHNGS